MELTWEKWLVMAALAGISTFLGVIPLIFFRKEAKIFPAVHSPKSILYPLILTALSCFGGGVLLTTAFCHMLTEAREKIANNDSVWEHLPEEFPLCEVLTLTGLVLIYLIEEIAHALMEGHDHHEILRHNSSIHSNRQPSFHSDCDNMKIPRMDTSGMKKLEPSESSFEDEKPAGITSIMRSMLALIALSFHAIMEGVAIGVQESVGVWFMFGAVASHKFVISFCMGMELFTAKAKLFTHLSSVLFFGVISSVGIFIGSLIPADNANSLVIAIIEALSTGTLLYVVFFEILNREREKKTHGRFKGSVAKYVGFLQFFFVVVGMAVMLTLITVVGHGHDHEHEHEHEHDHGCDTTTVHSGQY